MDKLIIVLFTVQIIFSLLNIVGMAYLFKGLYVTNQKIEEGEKHKKEVNDKFDELKQVSEKNGKIQSDAVALLHKIVDLL